MYLNLLVHQERFIKKIVLGKISIVSRYLAKNELVVIQGIDSYFYSQNLLQIDNNEYIKYDFSCFKKATKGEINVMVNNAEKVKSQGVLNRVLLGDINFDSKLDHTDIELITYYVEGLKQPTEGRKFIADVNGDRILSYKDVALATNMLKGKTALKYIDIEKGDNLKYISDNNKIQVYEKVNGKEKAKRFLTKNEIVVIQEIDSDFLNKNILKINRNEYIKNFKAACFKKVNTVGNVFGNGKYEINGEIYSVGNGIANENGEIFIDSNGRKFNLYKQNSTEFGNLKVLKLVIESIITDKYGNKIGQKTKDIETTLSEVGCYATSISTILSGYGFTDNPQIVYNDTKNRIPKYYFENKGFKFEEYYVWDKSKGDTYNLIQKKLEDGYKIVVTTYGECDPNLKPLYTKIAGQSLKINQHAYTLLDVRKINGKIEVFYSDPDAEVPDPKNINKWIKTDDPVHGWYVLKDNFTNIHSIECVKKQ